MTGRSAKPHNHLDSQELGGLVEQAAREAAELNGVEDVEAVVVLARETYRRVMGDQLQEEGKEITSITSYQHYARRRFNKAEFAEVHPEAEVLMNAFCFRLRAKAALALHPEYIEELAQFILDQGVKKWTPKWIRDSGETGLLKWLSTNVRDASGEIDWVLIAGRVKVIHTRVDVYPVFDRRVVSEKGTIDDVLERARENLNGILANRNHWYPSDLDKERGEGGHVYEKLTRHEPFRRPAARPDLEKRGIVKVTRPNWYKIAAALGPEYLMTMVIGRGEELEYRTMQDALHQLQELLIHHMWPLWSAGFVEKQDANLYNWFRAHVLNEGVTWEDIATLCGDSRVKENYRAFTSRS